MYMTVLPTDYSLGGYLDEVDFCHTNARATYCTAGPTPPGQRGAGRPFAFGEVCDRPLHSSYAAAAPPASAVQ